MLKIARFQVFPGQTIIVYGSLNFLLLIQEAQNLEERTQQRSADSEEASMSARALSAPWRQGGLQARRAEASLENEASPILHSETLKQLGVSGPQGAAAPTESRRASCAEYSRSPREGLALHTQHLWWREAILLPV